MGAPTRARPRRAKGATPARSLRVSDDDWDKARKRAEYEGHTVSSAAALLIAGYGQGLINLPQIKVVYEQPKGD